MSSSVFVLDELRNAIVDGQLAPGVPLRQEDLAERFGVSHIPVREALRQLEAEGLVLLRPRRGAMVAELSADEYEEINEMRIALESCALRLIISRITEDEMRNAAAILDRIDRESERWGALNTEFHRALYTAAKRPRMLATILSLNRNAERYLHREVQVVYSLGESQREHRRLLELIAGRNADEACALLAEHIAVPGASFVHHLRTREGQD